MRDKDDIIAGLEQLERDLRGLELKSMLRDAISHLKGESNDHMRCTHCGMIVDITFEAEFPDAKNKTLE